MTDRGANLDARTSTSAAQQCYSADGLFWRIHALKIMPNCSVVPLQVTVWATPQSKTRPLSLAAMAWSSTIRFGAISRSVLRLLRQ